MKFQVSSPAKVNLVLRIGRLRDDGFHDLASLMARLQWGDLISGSIERSKAFSFRFSGDQLGIPLEKNLLFRAADALSQRFSLSFEMRVRLRKRIPTEAGLGGGSSNAASILLLLGRFFKLPTRELLDLAADIGSDVPFFLSPTNAAWCLGRGERLTPVQIPSRPLLVVQPRRTKVSTAWAYRELDRLRAQACRTWPLDTENPAESWSLDLPRLENDFEELALERFAELRRLKVGLAQSGALTGQMSGSGSCFFGIYRSLRDRNKAAGWLSQAGWRVYSTTLAP
jgi:4-diphosphocytidyl-2-C-methyl-D-erythritol kinase